MGFRRNTFEAEIRIGRKTMYDAKKVRMNRLFANGKCLDVAIDHGVCNEPSFMDGLEDMATRRRFSGCRQVPTRSR